MSLSRDQYRLPSLPGLQKKAKSIILKSWTIKSSWLSNNAARSTVVLRQTVWSHARPKQSTIMEALIKDETMESNGCPGNQQIPEASNPHFQHRHHKLSISLINLARFSSCLLRAVPGSEGSLKKEKRFSSYLFPIPSV